MNSGHAALCSSPEWAEHIATNVLPAAVGPLDLGDEVLEIGPGYGASTRVLVEAVPRLTALEVDEGLAAALSTSYPGVTVVQGSGDDLPFEDGRFTRPWSASRCSTTCTRRGCRTTSSDRRDGCCGRAASSPGRTASRARGCAASTTMTSTCPST